MKKIGICILGLAIVCGQVATSAAQEFKAGVGRVDITPTEPIRLSSTMWPTSCSSDSLFTWLTMAAG